MELLVLLIIVYACKHAITDTKHAAGKSRQAYLKSADKRFPGMPKGKRAAHAARHDLGSLLSQLGHGLPATRHGFMTGWHQSREAHHKAMLGREEAKTANLETRAGAIGQLKDYRARQQAALEEIRSGKAPGKPGMVATDTCPDCGAVDGRPHLGTCPQAEGREGTPEGTSPEPAAAEEGPEPAAGREEPRSKYESWGPSGVPASPGGTTVTEDDWNAPLPGEEGSAPAEEATPSGTSSSVPETDSPTTAPSTEGNTSMAGDTSYNEIDTGLGQDRDTAEAAAAEQQQAAASAEEAANGARSALAKTNAMIDAASGLKLDPATVTELMEHAEAQQAAAAQSDAAHEAHLLAVAAHQRVMETAQTGQSTLRTNHGQYQEAHSNSPVDSADSEFYDE